MKWLTLTIGIGVVCALYVPRVTAAPKAEVIAETWELDFEFHDPQRIVVRESGGESIYWYVLFRVVNNTGRDVAFYPSFRLVSDTLEVVQGGAGISPSVYDAIIARHRGEYPFLATPAEVTGPLLRGSDNGRSSIAVFRQFDPSANEFTVYVAGLSGDMARVPNPRFDGDREESLENPRFFVLRRTLALTYRLPGDPGTRRYAAPQRIGREWVMR